MTLEERQPRTRTGPGGWRSSPPLATVDRRAVRALLYLSLVAVGFVVLWFAAQLVSVFSDILGIFFLAWLLAFLVDPIASRSSSGPSAGCRATSRCSSSTACCSRS